MFLSNASIRRPVAMACLIIALFLLGANSYRKLALENLPRLDIPYLTVIATFPGASPEEIETDVARKIEDAVGTVSGLKHITSTCMENVAQIVLEFENGIDPDDAANDVRAQIDSIVNDLPSAAEKPLVVKFDVNAKPIVNLALTGDLSLGELYDYADHTLSDRLSAISGVAEVQLIGGSELEVQVLLDRDAVAGHGFTSLDVIQAIQAGIQTTPSGRIRQGGSEYSVKFDAEYDDVKSIGDLEVANKDGARFYLKDLGEVVMSTEEVRQAAYIDGQPCIAMRVVKKSNANAVEVAGQVSRALESIKKSLPGGMKILWVSDDADFVQASVDSTLQSIIQGVLLTAVILFLFLFDIRSTIIVAFTMPLTIIISLFFINLLGMTLNTSTLLAMGLSIGVLVTNSIVVLESISSRTSAGMEVKEASREGAAAVIMAVLASAGTNVVVLLPVAMMGSVIGQYFRPFALTTVVVTVVSLFISFTLTPMLSSLLLKPRLAARVGLIAGAERAWNNVFNYITSIYGSILKIIMKRRLTGLLVVGASFALLVGTIEYAGGVGFSFMPDNDRGEVIVKLEYPTRYNLEHTLTRVQEVEKTLEDLPHLRHLYTTVGKVESAFSGSEGVHLAQILIKFVPMTERPQSIEELAAEIRSRFRDYPDCTVGVGIPTASGSQEAPINIEIKGDDLDRLDQLALQLKEIAQKTKGVVDADASVRPGKPEIRIKPRRAVLSDRQYPVQALGSTLRANLEGMEAGVYKRGDRSYDIRVKLAEQDGKKQVERFLFPGEAGRPVTLTSLAVVEQDVAPVQITRRDKSRISRLQANLDGSAPLGNVVNDITNAFDQEVDLPPGYEMVMVGFAEIMGEAIADFGEAILMAMVLTYLLLAAILESFGRPFIILITLPLALIGVLASLYFTGNSISIFVLLGMVMLIGIVVNNAILIMDRLKQHTDRGVPPREAMVRAAADQFRPIVMITVAAILGMLPLALGGGLGSESRQGIGISSAAGIGISGLLTFFVLPALYSLVTPGKKADKKE